MASDPGQVSFLQPRGTTYSSTPRQEVVGLPEEQAVPRTINQDYADAMFESLARHQAWARQSQGLASVALGAKDRPGNVIDIRVAEHRDTHYGSTAEMVASHQDKRAWHLQAALSDWEQLWAREEADMADLMARNMLEVLTAQALTNKLKSGEDAALNERQRAVLDSYLAKIQFALGIMDDAIRKQELYKIVTAFYLQKGRGQTLRQIVIARRSGIRQ